MDICIRCGISVQYPFDGGYTSDGDRICQSCNDDTYCGPDYKKECELLKARIKELEKFIEEYVTTDGN